MKPPILPGYAVFSKKGRDKGRYFVVLYTLDAEFVMMADGDTRKLDHMKKKRRKHLCACPHEFPELLMLQEKGQLKDSDIRKALSPLRRIAHGEPSKGRQDARRKQGGLIRFVQGRCHRNGRQGH